eukprot:CAMPEP_0197025864 /NCGR_PEP_ID=MMETSP1384-20130603/6068_1 /TAXON_ID=29189 /ORGANISM="Ammonia sp." /LENGTH=535 /DNA_ID=CAMNT_0042454443 /DNA_START=81 /DNA_END=1685 /DNA_ORIENTATION=-
MAWNAPKSFQQKYRVFSAAFWENTENTAFDLERSDKIVLPPSALNALTACNAPFPVLLKVQIIDPQTNKPKASNIFCYVVDYSAPEGLIYMSSWMISKLSLDQSGQSVVELSLPTLSDLTYQCPTAELVQFQPHSLQLMLMDNVTDLVHKSLAEYYSSLRVDDVITVYPPDSKQEFKLTVTKIAGKETIKYTPKVVRLSNSSSENLMLGFTEPKDLSLPADADQNDDDQKQPNDADNKEEADSDAEWEIVSVEKVKSLSDLQWVEPGLNDKHKNDDDVKLPNNNNNNNNVAAPKEEEQKQPAVVVEPVKPKEAEIVYTEWTCPKCSSVNEISYKFCPKCGCNKEAWKPPPAKQPEKEEEAVNAEEPAAGSSAVISDQNKEEINAVLLKNTGIINDGSYRPSEKRQTGWIVKNITDKSMDVHGKLIQLGGDSDVLVKFEEKIQFQMKPNDEMFILIEVEAPPLPNQYHQFYQLVLANDEKKRICDMLQLPVKVEKQFDDGKEQKIKQIVQMGFSDRDRVITALKKWKWDELKAINW